jgi:hypothetical protein
MESQDSVVNLGNNMAAAMMDLAQITAVAVSSNILAWNKKRIHKG